jgi:hypothetical protein
MENFLRNIQNWDNHRYFLWLAIKEIGSGTIYEMGCGHGSSPFLCNVPNFKTKAFETDEKWSNFFRELQSDKYSIKLVSNWDSVNVAESDIILIDHAPGERRKEDIKRYREQGKGILVAHDTEPNADHGYKMRDELKKFKYMIDYKTDGAWATAASNYYNVTLWNVEEISGNL